MFWLKQNTAFSFRMGQFVDSVDGHTPETALVIGQADIQISKNGGAFAQTSDAAPVTTHDTDGFYIIPLTAIDTNTLGPFKVQVTVAGARTVVQECMVVPANVYDSLVSNTAFLSVNVHQISEDQTAADNLELQYDGTGLSGTTFPASQAQVQSLTASGTTEAVSVSSYTLTTGVLQSGTINNLLNDDGSYHTHTDSGGTLSLLYEFNVSEKGRATGVTFKGYVQGSNDIVYIDVYNWNTAQYVQSAQILGTNTTTNIAKALVLTEDYTSKTGTIGLVRVRFRGTGLTGATLAVDQLYVSRIIIPTRLGYTDNLVWIDTLGTNTGTVLDVDGTESNPVNTLADAELIAAQFNYSGYGLFPNSSITLVSNSANLNFLTRGALWNLNLGGQDVSGSLFTRARVSGVMTSTGFRTRFEDQCVLRQCTVGNCIVQNGVLDGNVKTIIDGTLLSIRDSIESTGLGITGPAPIDFNNPSSQTVLELYNFTGAVELFNSNANCLIEVYGVVRLVLNSSCTGGTIIVGPTVGIEDNSGGAFTIIKYPVYTDVSEQVQSIDTTVQSIEGTVQTIEGDVQTVNTRVLAVKAKTDRLTYSHNNDLDVNIKSINDNDIKGGGNTPAGYV